MACITMTRAQRSLRFESRVSLAVTRCGGGRRGERGILLWLGNAEYRRVLVLHFTTKPRAVKSQVHDTAQKPPVHGEKTLEAPHAGRWLTI